MRKHDPSGLITTNRLSALIAWIPLLSLPTVYPFFNGIVTHVEGDTKGNLDIEAVILSGRCLFNDVRLSEEFLHHDQET